MSGHTCFWNDKSFGSLLTDTLGSFLGKDVSNLVWPLEFLPRHNREYTLSCCIVECLIYRFVFVKMNLLRLRRCKLSLIRTACSMANYCAPIDLIISQELAIGSLRDLVDWRPLFHWTNRSGS